MPPEERLEETTGLSDAIDFHVHAGPSFWARKHDAIELAERIHDAGFGGAVLKSHFGNTFAPAGLANARVPEVELYPALALNPFVGGFNPSAVELAVETGARVVWFPTFSAGHFETTKHYPFSEQSMRATDETGELRDDVRDVLKAIADADRSLVVGNGHLSPDETWAVFDAMEDLGMNNPYLITHADSAFMDLSVDDQVSLAERGAIVEKCYLPVVKGDVTVAEMVDGIRDIGVGRCVLSTDHGQPDNESPPAAYAAFLDSLREHGLSTDEIRQMAVETSTRLLSG